MGTLIKSIEQLDAEYAEKRAEIEQQNSLLNLLPTGLPEPYMLHTGKSFRPSWVSYKVKTLPEAVAILRAYGKLKTISAIESGCLSISPEGEHSKQYADKPARWVQEEAIELRQHGGKGFYSVHVDAYPVTPSVRVSIEVEAFPWAAKAHMRCTYTQHGEPANCRFEEPEALKHCGGIRTKFAGGSADAFDLRYHFGGCDALESWAQTLEKKQAA